MRAGCDPVRSEPPSEPDVAVVGAGAAGIAAARVCLAAGLTVAVIEARGQVGGRAVTVPIRGHAVDLGPHWLHAGLANPLARLAESRGERLRRVARGRHLFLAGRAATEAEGRARRVAFERADRVLTQRAREPEDRDAAAALPVLGPWRGQVAAVHGLVSGRPLEEVSLKDFPSLVFAGNRFIGGGLGAYVARLARGLPVRLDTAVEAIDFSGAGVALETGAGRLRARAAIVTVPPAVLQSGAVRFTPALPEETGAALHAFLPGTYEHVVLHWPGAPFRGADRLASLAGAGRAAANLLTFIDGTPFHYFELDHPTALELDRLAPGAEARHARAVLAGQFGASAIRDLAVPAVTRWRHDPLARGSWSVLPPGGWRARDAVKAPVAERLWFAGEFASRPQAGTFGGAWEEGERAAAEVIAALRRPDAARASQGFSRGTSLSSNRKASISSPESG
jgi:monoamine oxidase